MGLAYALGDADIHVPIRHGACYAQLQVAFELEMRVLYFLDRGSHHLPMYASKGGGVFFHGLTFLEIIGEGLFLLLLAKFNYLCTINILNVHENLIRSLVAALSLLRHQS